MAKTEETTTQPEAPEGASPPEPGSAPATAQEKPRTRGPRKVRIGTVVSAKSDKTVVVQVVRQFPHPLYGKQVTRTKKYHAHDEKNEHREGDVVRIMETRPLSKLKRWRVVDLIERPE